VATVFGRVDRDHDLVTEAGGDLVVATGAAVGLHRLVRLDVPYLDVGHARYPNSAQSTSAAMTTSATATIARSLPRFACARNGFNPIPLR
jgi:hypothetical protein